MSLVYLLTRLPKLRLGEPAPLTPAELIRRARLSLENEDWQEFERVAMLEEVDETVRSLNRAHSAHAGSGDPVGSGPGASRVGGGNASAGAPPHLAAFVRTERERTALDRAPRDLPEWTLDPLPQHVLQRRYWQHLIQETHSELLRSYARFHVNLEEALTALRCQREGLSRADFLEQMSGHFDSSSRVSVEHFGQADLGIAQRFAWWPRLIAALDARDRVEGERALDRLRFEAIDSLEGVAPFSVEAVAAAYYRLRIIERESSWDYDKGLAALDEVLTIAPLEEAIGTAT